MQLSDLLTRVRNYTGRTDKDSVATDGINFAITSEIPKLHDFSAMRAEASTTVNLNDKSFTLAADFLHLVEVRVIDPSYSGARRLEIKDKFFVTQRYPVDNPFQSGWPIIGYIESGAVNYYPPSSRTYTIKYTYTKQHPTLVGTTDSLLIPLIDKAVIHYAASEVFASLEQFQSAQWHSAKFGESIKLAIAADKRDPARVFAQELHGETVQYPLSSEPWNDPFIKST